MLTPRIEINHWKIAHNTKVLKALYASKKIQVTAVTKGICGNIEVANTLVKGGIQTLGDSRMSNIKKMRKAGVKAKFILLRTPLLSHVRTVIEFADISLNSELVIIEALSACALDYNLVHKILLMVELGDLREGLLPSHLEETVRHVLQLDGVELIGIGANLYCLNQVRPDEKKMQFLSTLAEDIERKFSLHLHMISGGNSANYSWFRSTKNVGRINNLRLGESILLGRDPITKKPIQELFTDAFTLVAEVIECKVKRQGSTRRAILGIGLQDVLISGLTPRLNVDILGASSDHMVIDTKMIKIEVGNQLVFDLDYHSLLSAMTSPDIKVISIDMLRIPLVHFETNVQTWMNSSH